MAPEADFPVFAEPGDTTGIYYIIVAGLPWNCSWQELKDYTRNVPDGTKINVDHVVVYKGLTNGWVRVKDKKSFQRALEHLDGGVLNGHALLADGRNETMWTHLRSLDSPQQNTRRSRGSDTRNEYPTGQPKQQQQPQVTGTGYIYATPESTPTTPHFPHQQLPGTLYADCYTPTIFYAPHQLPFQPPNTPQQSPFMSPVSLAQGIPLPYIPVPPPFILSPPTPTQMYYPWSPPTQSQITIIPQSQDQQQHKNQSQHQNQNQKHSEARRIIIKKLPSETDEASLQSFLHSVLPHTCGTPQFIEIRKVCREGSRAYALVTFSDSTCAQHAIDALDGIQFSYQILSVSLAKPSSPSSSKFGKKRGGGGASGGSEKRRDVGGYVLRTLKDAGTLPQNKGVLASEKEKGKEKEVYFPTVSDVDLAMDLSGENERLQVCVKRERGSGTPMIVDGSTSRGRERV